jgi:hypothetical protein
MRGSTAIGIPLDTITSGTRVIGLAPHIQVRGGWLHDTRAACTTEAIGEEAAGESSTTTIGIVTAIGTTGGKGSTTR